VYAVIVAIRVCQAGEVALVLIGVLEQRLGGRTIGQPVRGGSSSLSSPVRDVAGAGVVEAVVQPRLSIEVLAGRTRVEGQRNRLPNPRGRCGQ
jgi:hypothetical protein